jgi:hypothetical protein
MHSSNSPVRPEFGPESRQMHDHTGHDKKEISGKTILL